MFALRLVLGMVVNFLIYAALLLVPAGTLHWWRAWFFFAVVWIGTALTMLFVFRGRRDLLEQRLRSPIQKDQPLSDKILVFILLLTYIGQVALIPIDRFHLHLMRTPGVIGSSLGMIIIVAGWWIISLAFRENRFAVPSVRYQSERRHQVADTGVYSVVRHPMYAGAILYFIGVALWLESYPAALAAALPAAALAARIVFEEAFLREKLPGYDEYMKKVRWRLIPGVW